MGPTFPDNESHRRWVEDHRPRLWLPPGGPQTIKKGIIPPRRGDGFLVCLLGAVVFLAALVIPLVLLT